jgi:hypothetical protein
MNRSSISSVSSVIGMAAAAVVLGACASHRMPLSDVQHQLEQREQELASLQDSARDQEKSLSQSQSRIQDLERELKSASLPGVSSAPPSSSGAMASGADLLPPGAKPGECYARTFVPPSYETKTVSMLKKDASDRVEIVPARFETVQETVLVKEATEKIEIVPATYEWVEERILVREASTRLEQVPAVYETITEKVLVKPAHTTWKQGRGPIEKMDAATGEIMCMIDVPAEYKSVSKRALKTPATMRSTPIPAQYKTVKKQMVKTPASTRSVVVPAVNKTVNVVKLVEPERERRIEIPAEYQTVSQRDQVSDGRMEWRPVLCETNATRSTVRSIQQALDSAGHSPGAIDGVLGRTSLAAVRSYQQAKGLATGGLTYATIDSLGVKVGR